MLRRAPLIAAMAAITLTAAACGSSSKPSTSATTTGSGTTIASGSGTSGNKSSAPGITPTTITLGLITSLSGAASSEDTHMVDAVRARIDVTNAAGGLFGRQIKLDVADDQSSAQGSMTASQDLINKGVFGVIDSSAFVFGGYKALQVAGVPVTGGAYDGPEWGEKPNTNMFSISDPEDPHQPAYTTESVFLKEHGATTVAGFGYGENPSSSAAAKGFMVASAAVGLKKGYLDTSIPFGSVNVTPIALSLKSTGSDGLYMAMDENTNFAIVTAAKQAGANLKAVISATGYGQTLLDDTAALPAANGTYFPPTGVPVEDHTPATIAFQAALAKYANFTGDPDFDWYEGWGGTDLMIAGLQMAGQNPTRSTFMSKLHSDSDYTGGGLFPAANMTLAAFGTAPKTLCSYFTELEGNKFVPVPASGAPTCGTLVPNSNQL